MSSLVLPFSQISAADLLRVGGKGANLGELSRAGLPVPEGLCITTAAWRCFVATVDGYAALLEALERPEDTAALRQAGAALRARLLQTPLPDALTAAIADAWTALGAEHAYAVRSSATAEDLPDASFAGQQDTFLNVRGLDALLAQTRACFASLFTDRAILYRNRNRIPHRDVAISVVVQRMVIPDSAGILFTADPLTGHRHITVIDASFGLGEALVSGLVSADLYRLDRRSGALVEAKIGDKAMAIRALPDGGTVQVPLSPEQRTARVLSDAELHELVALGEAVQDHQGCPQDIEWAFADGALFLLQARPITSLYPLPAPAPSDDALHLYFSFGHFQVMPAAMPVMSRSLWRVLFPFGRLAGSVAPNPWFPEAGGRLYVDISPLLRRRRIRHLVVAKLLPGVDVLAAQALAAVAARPEFQRGPKVATGTLLRWGAPMMRRMLSWLLIRRPEDATRWADDWLESMLSEITAQQAAAAPGAPRLRILRARLAGIMPPLLLIPPVAGAGMLAGRLLERLASPAPASLAALKRGLPGNVTTEMDLGVGDLADVARQCPAVAAALQGGERDVGALTALEGGAAFAGALAEFLARYGMRAPAEIDLQRPRWRDDPTSILQMVASNLSASPGAHRAHHRQLQADAVAAIDRIAAGAPWPLRALVRRLARQHHYLLAIREHPKFFLVRLLDLLRGAILEAGALLVAAGRLRTSDDVWHLPLGALIDALEDPAQPLQARVDEQRLAHERDQRRRPPRVLTSDGESPHVTHSRADLPAGALAGTPVSSGVIEGIARVVLDPATDPLHPGEILVVPFTDPGWTPLLLNAAGLVMEVGGVMTHGSVIAREYGIPAVVCVPDATTAIRTGDRLRVDGDRGIVQVISEAAP